MLLFLLLDSTVVKANAHRARAAPTATVTVSHFLNFKNSLYIICSNRQNIICVI